MGGWAKGVGVRGSKGRAGRMIWGFSLDVRHLAHTTQMRNCVHVRKRAQAFTVALAHVKLMYGESACSTWG